MIRRLHPVVLTLALLPSLALGASSTVPKGLATQCEGYDYQQADDIPLADSVATVFSEVGSTRKGLLAAYGDSALTVSGGNLSISDDATVSFSSSTLSGAAPPSSSARSSSTAAATSPSATTAPS